MFHNRHWMNSLMPWGFFLFCRKILSLFPPPARAVTETKRNERCDEKRPVWRSTGSSALQSECRQSSPMHSKADQRNHVIIGHMCHGQKSRFIGDGHPAFNRNPYNGYINLYCWVDDHPLLYGNHGSLDPGTYLETRQAKLNNGPVVVFSTRRLNALKNELIKNQGIYRRNRALFMCPNHETIFFVWKFWWQPCIFPWFCVWALKMWVL